MRKIAVIGTDLAQPSPRASKVEVFDWEDISSDTINLRDYDGVVFDVSGLQGTIAAHAEYVLSPSVLLDILKVKNSFVAIIGNPATTLSKTSLAEKLGIKFKTIRGVGELIRVSEDAKGGRFETYISKVKRFSYSYDLQLRPTDEMKRLVTNSSTPEMVIRSAPLLTTRAGYGIAALCDVFTFMKNHYDSRRIDKSDEPFKGMLVFLPPLDSADEHIESLLSVVDSSYDETVMPEWAEEISVVGQHAVDTLIEGKESKLAEITGQLENLSARRIELRQAVEMLYKTDKPLEKSLKLHLSKLGFTVIEPKKESNKVEFYLEQNGLKFVVEVKSTTKQMFDMKGLRQANDWRDDVLLETGEKYKPLFIGSNQHKSKPSERSTDYLAQNLIEYAESRDIACITVNQLFSALQKIESKEMTVAQLASQLHATKGLYVEDKSEGNQDSEPKG